METLIQDVRYGLRMLRKSPGFTAIAVLTLALGIGANTAIFSVVRAVLLKSLPYPEPDHLMVLDEYQEHSGRESVAWPNFLDWQAQNQSFEALASYHDVHRTLTGYGEPVLLRCAEVSAPFFSILDVKPILGRTFTQAEDKPGAAPTALLSYGLWRNLLGGDRSVLGREITLSGESFTVVGVAPADFKYFQQHMDVYLPIGLEGARAAWINRENHPGLLVVGRLKSGVSQKAAQNEMDTIMRRLEQQYPASNSGERALITPLFESRISGWRTLFYTLLAAVASVLLIACVNVANLLLARATTRQKEFAVRAAIGAARGRIVRQLLTESILLALIGGSLGLAIAPQVLRPLLHLAPQDVPRLGDTTVDQNVALFTFLISALTGILFGMAPAFYSARTEVNVVMKEGSATSTAARGRQKLRAGLLVSEVALAVVLVAACGLLVRSLLRAQQVNPGFEADHILALDVLLPSQQYKTEERIRTFWDQALDRVRSLPGVVSASAVMCPPLVGTCWTSVYLVSDRPVPSQSQIPSSVFNAADPMYFRTMKIPLLAGRQFSDIDTPSSPPVIIINKTLADLWWPHESPLGKRIKQGFPQDDGPYREIIGVVGDLKQDGPDAQQLPEAFEPASQSPYQAMTLVVRTQAAPLSMASDVEAAIHSVDKDLPLSAVQPMTRYLSESLSRRIFSTLLLAIFGSLALGLAALGIYGVTAYAVAQRRREIGIRMALGASRQNVLTLVLSQGLRLGLLGVAIGLAASCLLTRWMASLLFGVSSRDPITFGLVALLLSAVALLACYLPARKAAQVDPMVALRYE
ncbi:MAG TPA: ABC transporter permease [Terriglobales bacterium]|nr:ABC transporter permease [Terriglobales bacterium]